MNPVDDFLKIEFAAGIVEHIAAARFEQGRVDAGMHQHVRQRDHIADGNHLSAAAKVGGVVRGVDIGRDDIAAAEKRLCDHVRAAAFAGGGQGEYFRFAVLGEEFALVFDHARKDDAILQVRVLREVLVDVALKGALDAAHDPQRPVGKRFADYRKRFHQHLVVFLPGADAAHREYYVFLCRQVYRHIAAEVVVIRVGDIFDLERPLDTQKPLHPSAAGRDYVALAHKLKKVRVVAANLIHPLGVCVQREVDLAVRAELAVGIEYGKILRVRAVQREYIHIKGMLAHIPAARLNASVRGKVHLQPRYAGFKVGVFACFFAHHDGLAAVFLMEQIRHEAAVLGQLLIRPVPKIPVDGVYAQLRFARQRLRGLLRFFRDCVDHGFPALHVVVVAHVVIVIGTERVDEPGDLPDVAREMVDADGELGIVVLDMAFAADQCVDFEALHIHLDEADRFRDVGIERGDLYAADVLFIAAVDEKAAGGARLREGDRRFLLAHPERLYGDIRVFGNRLRAFDVVFGRGLVGVDVFVLRIVLYKAFRCVPDEAAAVHKDFVRTALHDARIEVLRVLGIERVSEITRIRQDAIPQQVDKDLPRAIIRELMIEPLVMPEVLL